MRKLVVGVLLGALTLGGAVTALAQSSAQTTMDVKFRPGNKREGTRANPRANSVRITIDQNTTTGTGQPATTTAINVKLARQWRLNSELWPRRRRCNIRTVNQRGSDSVCPRGSRIGRGSANLLAANGGIKEFVNIRAYVIKNGDLGIFLDSPPGQPVTINNMVQGTTTRRRNVSVKIPQSLQQPIPGVKSAIDDLTLRLAGSAPTRRGRLPILQTTGCGRFWAFVIESRYDDGGRIRDSHRVSC
jgi:hypothetical protein